MGVYARNHAQQLILDLADANESSPLPPRAQLLLLHMALNFGGDQSKATWNVRKGRIWDKNTTYFEGLGKKARAIGYNVPEQINGNPGTEAWVPDKTRNKVKAAVAKAVNELIEAGMIEQIQRGQTKSNATYRLSFLSMACSTCTWTDKETGELKWDQTMHLPPEVREAAQDQAENWAHSVNEKPHVANKPKSIWGPSANDPWMTGNDDEPF